MMTEKQKKIYVVVGIAGFLWITIIIGVVAHIVLAGDGFTLEDLKNLRNQVAYEKEEAGKDTGDGFTLEDLKNLRKQVEKQAEGVEECVPDCLMQQSEIEEKLGMLNGGQCFDECEVNMRAGTEVCYERVCRYDKKIGRKMYAITVKYSSWEGQSGAESMDWEVIDD